MSTASSPEEPFPRRPEFDPESIPVLFGSALLYLPPPRFTLRRRRRPDGSTFAEPARSFGVDFDRLVDRVTEAAGSGAPGQPVPWDLLAVALFDLAADLIRRNYEVDETRLDQLLTFCPRDVLDVASEDEDDPRELPDPWGSVWRVALGLGPKSRGVGSSPPVSSPESTPTA